MKLKKTLPVIALATLMGVGVFSGIRQNVEKKIEKVAEAAAGDSSDWCLIGSSAELGSWTAADALSMRLTNDSRFHSWYRINLAAGVQFKALKGKAWNGSEFGWAYTYGNAKGNFKEASSDNNIEVVVAGTYDICVEGDSQDTTKGANYIGLYYHRIGGYFSPYLIHYALFLIKTKLNL